MRLRFNIRDLLWLTVVVALAAGWWLERHSHNSWHSIRSEDGSVMIFNHNTGEEVFLRTDGVVVTKQSNPIR